MPPRFIVNRDESRNCGTRRSLLHPEAIVVEAHHKELEAEIEPVAFTGIRRILDGTYHEVPIIEDDYVVLPDENSDDATAQFATGSANCPVPFRMSPLIVVLYGSSI